ncbi:hypothetical protein ABIA85_006649 [Bradyrhizobium sp. LA6.10]|uniref:NACHT domain-containing protein n=1 Tax=Bradyrhizobium sp. LA6.10 TaxID=3156318 RepID=UPI003394F1B6
MSTFKAADIDRRVQVIAGAEKDTPSIKQISDLRSHRFVVLLGEPGIGKSTVLSREAVNEGTAAITIRALMTGTEPPSGETLFLDALDEYRTDGSAEDKVHLLANAMAKCDRSRWRLTCRSEDWRKAADIEPISKAAAGHSVTVVQLLPLSSDEASAILSALGEPDPGSFLNSAHAFGASGLIESPLGLRLLRSAVADGGAWPARRFDLFASATRKLAFEKNPVRSSIKRHNVDQILSAAEEVCLLLLLSGARAIWRSNNEPPSSGDAREFLTRDDLQIERTLFDDMLDTPLFRGEGETFEPLHKTVAEFLGAGALSKLVTRSPLPFERAAALIAGDDGCPPTELRGLFAWFAAHLAIVAERSLALRLIEADPVTVLCYGDAAVFNTTARKEMLSRLGRSDPYYRASEVGVTAVGGLAGEDLAGDFAEIIAAGQGDGTHRLMTVFEALTMGEPVASLRQFLRSVSLDAARPEWVRRRSIEAYLNGAEDRGAICRNLFDALSQEPVSICREALRSDLASRFNDGDLRATEVRAVLSDYRRCDADNVMGRLFSLSSRLQAEALPDLFEEPIASWLPASNDRNRDHGIEVGHLLDEALAAAIRKTPSLTGDRLCRWLTNVRRERWSPLKERTTTAVGEWLDAEPNREVELFRAMLANQAPNDVPWAVPNEYYTITRRPAAGAIVRGLLATNEAGEISGYALSVAVEIAVTARDEAAYWLAYNQVSLSGSKALLVRLTTSQVDEWRREQAIREAKSHEDEQAERAKTIKVLEPICLELATGLYPQNLEWAAQVFFERDGEPSVRRLIDRTSLAIAEAITAGWAVFAINGFGDVDAAKLGTAEAERKRYYVETAAVAGVYRLLKDGDRLRQAPLIVALAVLKSSWVAGGEDRRKMLDRWAVARMTADPAAGARELVAYWNAALDAGAEELPNVWQFQSEDNNSPVLKLALETLLIDRPTLLPSALRCAIRAAAKSVDASFLIEASRLARVNTEIGDATRVLWKLIAWVLDPVGNDNALDADSFAELRLDDANSDLFGALGAMEDVDPLPMFALTIRVLGAKAAPSDMWSGDEYAREPQRRSEIVRRYIQTIAGDTGIEAAQTLCELAGAPGLDSWRTELRHAQAQQRRLMRDHNFRHPKPKFIRAALYCGPPVNASDLRAVAILELRRLRAELRTTATQPWKHYWSRGSHGEVTNPLIENECRNYLLDRLQDRLGRYHIAAALPEAARGEGTRADMLILTGAGRSLPVEAKRHFHADLWVAASTQLQGYAAAPGADGLGVYLVFWFGLNEGSTAARPDGLAAPSSGEELEQMLVADLTEDLRARTDVLVFDVSAPATTRRRKKKSERT